MAPGPMATEVRSDLLERALSAYEAVVSVRSQKLIEQMLRQLEPLGVHPDPATIKVDDETGRAFVDVPPFRFRVRLGKPELFAWWVCPVCDDAGDAVRVDALETLGEVGAGFVRHQAPGNGCGGL